MANISSHSLAPSQLPDPNDTQDYGSDFNEEELQELNREVDRIYGTQKATQGDIEDNPITNNVEYIPTEVSVARIPPSSQSHLSQYGCQPVRIEFQAGSSISSTSNGSQIAYPDLTSPLSDIEPSQIDVKGPEPQETEVEADPIEGKDAASDTRSPILRYRAPPRRALSVTDLVSPAWCELQYSFDLSKHGRKKATPAMKMGTVVHEKLETEKLEADGYVTVPVQVTTKEEKWGLRLWNVVSGLQILAETGMTRELEVWGIIGGEAVGGVIDEVSLTCPKPELEEAMTRNDERNSGDKVKKEKALERGQPTLNTFMLGHGATSIDGALGAPLSSTSQSVTPTLYITDVKTRRARSLPNDVSARPTKYQLMLYQRMLSAMIAGTFDFAPVAEHYKLDIEKPFGDAFIAQIAALDGDLDLILSHNSLAALWSLLPDAAAKIAESNGGTELKVSPILTAEYRDNTTGDVRGTKTFLYSDEVLHKYISNGMEWWHGEREARGVEIDEAFKCQICQFAPECEWRKNKVREAVTRNRGKKRGSGNGNGGVRTKTNSGFAPAEVLDETEKPDSM